jgi:hypothetical protein
VGEVRRVVWLKIVAGVAFVGMGLFFIARALFPGRLGVNVWRGGTRCGLLSGLGVGLTFAGAGGLLALHELLPEAAALCGLALVLGFPAAFVGSWLDHRRPGNTRPRARLPRRRR